MLKLLVKKQLAEIFRSYFYNAKTNKARSKTAIISYFVFFIIVMAGMLGGIFAFLSFTMCGPLAAAELDWLYFALMGMVAVFLGAFGSVFNTYSTLYMAKDNDLMLSLPIPVRTIMASRLLTVYLMGLMYSSTVMIPAVIVYLVVTGITPGGIAGGLALWLLISVFVMTLSCVLGWIVARISRKLKNKSLITVAVSIAFFGCYYFVCFRSQTIIQDVVTNAMAYGMKIKGAAYPIYLFGKVGTGDLAAMIIVSAVILALFALIWTAMSRSFLKLATDSGKTARREYRSKALKQRGLSITLLAREMSHFVSNPNYMLNCGLGILFLPIGGIAIVIKGGEIVSTLNLIFGAKPGAVPIILCTGVCLMASMNDMTAPSVSLEGRSLWLIQSLPVTPWAVLRAKLSMQLLLTAIPAAFCIACMALVYPFSIIELAFSITLIMAFIVLTAELGLIIGLEMPNLTWTSEITPIKQNLGVVMVLFGGIGCAIALFAGFMLLGGLRLGFAGYMALASAVTVIADVIMWRWLKTRGSRILSRL